MPLLICPNCAVGMTPVRRNDVEIDVCPQCRGVWLDRGELEKLLQPIRDETVRPAAPAEASFGGGAAGLWRGSAGRAEHDHHGDYHQDHSRGHTDHHGQGQGGRGGWRGLLDVLG